MLFTTRVPLILASASPRRKELLASLGLAFEIIPAGAEPPPQPGELPHDFVQRAAKAKCREIAAQVPGAWVLGADTVVAVAEGILGKPGDVEQALTMLGSLCGGEEPLEHVVCTGCCLRREGCADGESVEQGFVSSTLVTMAPQPEAVRAAYVATGEPMDKAGAYAIQGLGAFLVSEIRGSYTNVVGLPLAEVVEVLVSWGVIVPRQG